MSRIGEQIKHTVDITIPDKEDLTHENHPKMDYIMLILRNFWLRLRRFCLFFHFSLTPITTILMRWLIFAVRAGICLNVCC